EVSEFNKVHLKGSGNVFLSQGEEQSLIIKTDDNILPLIETDVSGKKLTISHGKHNLRPTVFEVFITVKNIEDVAISGSGIVRGKDLFIADAFYTEISGSGDMDLEVETGRLEAKISGSGSIHLSGKAEDYTVSISGSGEVKAFEVQAKNVSVKISGSGDCRVHAAESLVVKISGSGDVYYKGRPRIDTKISGSGSLISED
ncbi:MAG: head GIN domain-containing protein, partial [Desulfobacterales bacterium]